MKTFDKYKVEKAVGDLLSALGIDWINDDNFKETPIRVSKAMKEMNAGLYEEYNGVKVFKSDYKGMISFNNISAIGLCPHHLLPIEYEISFAYIPTQYVLGLSKVPRVIKNLCSRPVLQEDLTKDIVEYFEKKLHPLGMAVVVKGIHGCMKYRGIKEAEIVKTSELTGPFLTEPDAREEFYQLINNL